MKRILLCSIIMFLSYSISKACSCEALIPFCEQLKSAEDSEKGLVWIGEKISKDSLDFGLEIYQFKVKEILYGQVSQDTFILDNNRQYVNSDSIIWVVGGNGANCLEIYQDGEALFAHQFSNYTGYASDICNISYLYGDGAGNYSGFIYDYGIQSITKEDLKSIVAEPCVSSSKEFDNLNSITVMPNPAVDFVEINLNSSINNVNYSLLNTNGELIQAGNFNSHKNRLDLSVLKDGVYFLIIKDQNQFSSIPILKE